MCRRFQHSCVRQLANAAGLGEVLPGSTGKKDKDGLATATELERRRYLPTHDEADDHGLGRLVHVRKYIYILKYAK